MIDSVGAALAVLAAGVAAGAINTVVGSGTLITFPTLLALGVPPVTANVSNKIGLVPGSWSGVWGYRAELRGQAGRVLRFGGGSVLGGVLGALLLLWLPSSAFESVAPALIGLGVLLVVIGPRLARRVRERGGSHRWVWPAVAGTGVYGGYFGAAQGVILMAVLGIGMTGELQQHNALKNVLAGLVNAVSALVFVVVADPDWRIVGLVAAGSVVGGLLGAKLGRRLSPALLRGVIVVIGVVAVVALLL